MKDFSPDFLGFSAIIPLAVVGVAWAIERQRNKRNEKPPQAQKLLRPAGFSLSRKLDQTVDAAMGNLLFACGICPVAAFGVVFSGSFFALGASTTWLALSTSIFLIAASLTVCLSLRVLQQLRQVRILRLGLRGEQAVAEALHEVADCGYRIFHDLPGGDNWNIDHVAVGPRGVFVFETKARHRRGKCTGQPAHIARVKDDRLIFPSGMDAGAIPQAARNAKWLASYLAKRTGDPVHVKAVVVLPGWYVENNGTPGKTLVMNAVYLAGHLRHQPENLQPSQVKRIIAALDEKCRDVDF